jgi:hypothetical protein
MRYQSMAAEVELRRSVVVHCPRFHCSRLRPQYIFNIRDVVDTSIALNLTTTPARKATTVAYSPAEFATTVRQSLTAVTDKHNGSSFSSQSPFFVPFVSIATRFRRKQIKAIGRRLRPSGDIITVTNVESRDRHSWSTRCSAARRRKQPTRQFLSR